MRGVRTHPPPPLKGQKGPPGGIVKDFKKWYKTNVVVAGFTS